MEAFVKKKLYSELRTMKKELQTSLENNNCSPLVRPLIEEELKDVEKTMEKLENGNFGLCETSGEIIPTDYLAIVPTIQSLDDVDEITKYYCKPIFS
ncbi:hypothetical protein [Robertmurraya sp. Marseille-Q9965]